ncbi:MAG: tetratricopeptide repeat protein [Magnetospirillum sp.]|nr:tetratricopeptide repeat protein [Magnetospirillum sp.]
MPDPTLPIQSLLRAGRVAEAEAACRQALKSDPKSPRLLLLLGQILFHTGRPADAARILDKAASCRPVPVEAAIMLGVAQEALGKLDKAEKAYRLAIGLRPTAQACFNLGNVFRRQGRDGDALACYRQAHDLAPGDTRILGALIARKQALCDWEGLEALSARLLAGLDAGGAPVDPFRLLSLDFPEDALQRCARRWAGQFPARPAAAAVPPRPKERLTIGYLSADFRNHAVAHLAAELFERHDHTRFRILAYSVGPDDGSAMRRRLMAAFDAFHDMEDRPASVVAGRIAADGVDILVDLTGYTRGGRPDVLAARPAPIQVNYLGYPGTLGAGFADYIVADPISLPMNRQPFYDERIVHLPVCYQANDRKRPLPSQAPSRAECGLPGDAVVLACFNAVHKITPAVFAVWLDLLRAEDGTVLWLLADDPAAERALRAAAEGRGVCGGRLVFAPKVPIADHLARYRVADLFLDTVPYNAHTTASDALWVGCPVVTVTQGTFASRVAASLLNAVGLPGLACRTFDDYAARARALIRDPGERKRLRAHLEDGRASAPLFDTPRLARDLERAFATMWDRHVAGLPPASFAVEG